MSFLSITPGTRVIITQDCRPGSPATGMFGEYEGDFPRTVICKYTDDDIREYGIPAWEEYLKYLASQGISTPQKVEPGTQPPIDQAWWAYWPNPRIKLENGETIWGDECWWQPASDLDAAKTLGTLQADLAAHIQTISALAQIADDAQGADSPPQNGAAE